MSGYEELLKTAPKPLPNPKKEKKEKKEKKSSSKSKHHHKNHSKPNGKGRPSVGVKEVTTQPDSELKHLLTTIQVAAPPPPTLTPRPTPKSSPKADVTASTTSSKKPKKPKAPKKSGTLSSAEASILDGIFSSIAKESKIGTSSSPSSSSTLSPSPTVTQTTPASKASMTNCWKPVTSLATSPGVNTSILNSLHDNRMSVPPTLNKIPDAPPLMPLHSSDSSPDMCEMPPLIPAGVQEDSTPISDDANKFQDAFLLQLAESLKAKSGKTKSSKSKPKKSRKDKDKQKDGSKKSRKSESKQSKSKKEGKASSKEQKKSVQPPKPQRTSHLAELLMRPGSIDFSKIDSKNDVNGFYIAGASSSVPPTLVGAGSSVAPHLSGAGSNFAPTLSKTESVVHNMLQNPQLVVTPSNGVPKSAGKDTFPGLNSPVSVDTVKVHRNAATVEQKVFNISNANQNAPAQLTLKTEQHAESGLMSPGHGNQTVLPNFMSEIGEDDFLHNCIDPNLLQKPSVGRERSNSMDIGVLQRKTTATKSAKKLPQQQPVKDEYEFLPELLSNELMTPGVSNSATMNKKLPKSAGNKSKTKPKAKPKPKKKKPTPGAMLASKSVIPPSKPTPRSRSSSLPLPSVPVEAQNIMTNGMDLHMVQGMLSPPARSPNGTLHELERTHHHILSSIMQDRANQAVPPEQLMARQKAAIIMQEKFHELQQLQMQMKMSQQGERPSMPPLVELRRPPMHMGFPSPQDAMFNSMQRHPGNQQIPPGLRMPNSSAATMMSSVDTKLTSPRMGQPNLLSMASPSPQAYVPPQSPVMSPKSQQSARSQQNMVPLCPQSMMVPSPQGMLQMPQSPSFIPPSPKSKSMLPNSPTSMPPPSPQSGPPSSSSMMCSSPQSMMPPSPQSSAGVSNLQARLQQSSPVPGGPTSPIMMQHRMPGRSHTNIGMSSNQHIQQQMPLSPSMSAPPSPSMSPAQNMMPVNQQRMVNPRGMMNPMVRYPASSQQSQMPIGAPGHPGPPDRNPYSYGSPLHSPQSSPTGAPPAQRLPPLHSLLRSSSAPHGMPTASHGMPTASHGMPTASLPSPTSKPPSPRISPNNIHLPNQAFLQGGIPPPRGPHQKPPGYHQQHQITPAQRQHQMSPMGQQHQRSPMGQQHQMLPGHFQANMPIPHHQSRGFPVRMGFPSPPPSYPSSTSQAAGHARMQQQQNMNHPVSKLQQQHPGIQQDTNQQQQQHLSPGKPTVGIMNPWEWSISDVIQFIADAGEGACADPFRRQVRPPPFLRFELIIKHVSLSQISSTAL